MANAVSGFRVQRSKGSMFKGYAELKVNFVEASPFKG
jgi:hypothetical protein